MTKPSRHQIQNRENFEHVLNRLVKKFPHEPWLTQTLAFYESGYSQSEVLFCHLAAIKLHLEQRRISFFTHWLKRIFDLSVGITLLAFSWPLLLVVAALIKRSSPGAIFFRQYRVGRDFRIFRIFKFRTMAVDAELRTLSGFSHDPQPLRNRQAGTQTTSLGAFLRKYKIDELPQLLNVIKGDMSLIGPRPLSVADSTTCPVRYLNRFSVLPGMSGLWQAYRSNTIPALSKYRLDSYYAQNLSLWWDLQLAFKTIGSVVRGETPLRAANPEAQDSGQPGRRAA